MSGKPSIKNELIEEHMEGASLLDNFAEEANDVINSLNRSEEIDHKNDATRGDVMNFLLKSMECYNAHDYEGMQRNQHAAMQKLNEQGIVDIKDDIPRTNAKIKILKLQLKAIHVSERLKKLTGKISRVRQ